MGRLVDDYRLRCLWYLREDYYPTTDEERRRTPVASARRCAWRPPRARSSPPGRIRGALARPKAAG